MTSSHTTPTPEGEMACRYCGRTYASRDKADAHIRELARAGMLQDHIAIHWKGPSAGAAGRRTRSPRSWIDAFTMRFGDD